MKKNELTENEIMERSLMASRVLVKDIMEDEKQPLQPADIMVSIVNDLNQYNVPLSKQAVLLAAYEAGVKQAVQVTGHNFIKMYHTIIEEAEEAKYNTFKERAVDEMKLIAKNESGTGYIKVEDEFVVDEE